MQLNELYQLAEIFEYNAAVKKREQRYVLENERRFEEKKIQMSAEKEKQSSGDRLASTAQIKQLHEQLSTYNTAVVDALMDNEHALAEVRRQGEEIEEKAYKLSNGQSVFKSEDGIRVFDKEGNAVSHDIVDAQSIPDSCPHYEVMKAVRDKELALQSERAALHNYQDRLDQARDTLDKSGLTAREADDLAASLKQNMPDAVRKKVEAETHVPPEVQAPIRENQFQQAYRP